MRWKDEPLKTALCFVASACLLALTNCGSFVDHNVFMGDSITFFWSLPGVNLGIPGNTTPEMLARFPSEVLGHGFRTFVLLGGINDIRYGQTPQEALANIATMARDARNAQMVVVLCELTPDYQDHFKHDPDIRALNASIEQLAASEHYLLVDYYDPMYGHPEYFRDGLHPNAQGYEAMDRALVPVLESIREQ
ncbi:MAG TPA: GDSL-type esterase/lipase family protein [Terracidiphilus sp.]|nr:GDSL-type esterase/lipase family protein [Terracidiphilus sp.]